MRKIELLAPARNVETGIAGINHGADAVYIGPEAFGARRAAANSVDDIKRLADYAHLFRARIYATVNTIIYPDELRQAERLCHELYRAGVDALIVQDMSLLRLDIPPIELHASTQCDIRTPQKAQFLQEVGFSQLVLARELTLRQIKEIVEAVTVPVETFVHGALCVSYSGRCHASQLCMGRSANRGECAQMCRLPYSLTDAKGKVIYRDKHLLSLHDLNLSDRLEALLDAGVSSLKIEGRLKDIVYVKNVVAAYRKKLDEIIAAHPDKYCTSSYGESAPAFTPNLEKSFNRGFTHYFIDNRKPADLTSPLTPKSLGEAVRPEDLHSGDGIAFIDRKGEYTGLRVNRVEGKRIFTFGGRIEPGAPLRRTFDRLHNESVERSNPKRKLSVTVTLENNSATILDETGMSVSLPLPPHSNGEKNTAKIKEIFAKLGNTTYVLKELHDNLPEDHSYAPSALTALRRELVSKLERASRTTYPYGRRRPENRSFPYPSTSLVYADNVVNPVAAEFYRSHGVKEIEPALESSGDKRKGIVAMTCRHCILRELGKCLKTTSGKDIRLPLTITSGPHRFNLRFNCKECEMQLLYLPENK